MCASIQDSSLINWSKLCFDHSWQVEQPVLSECCRIKMSGDQLAPPAPLLCCNARWWQWLVLASGPWAARGVFVIFNQERWQLQSNVESSKDVFNRLRGMAWKSEVEKDWSWWKCHIFSLREKAWHWEDLRLRGIFTIFYNFNIFLQFWQVLTIQTIAFAFRQLKRPCLQFFTILTILTFFDKGNKSIP